MQYSIDNLHARDALLGLDIHGNSAAVIHNGDGVVGVDGDFNFRAVAGQGFIHGVVHDLVDQVMKSGRGRASDIHAGTAADSLQTLQDLDLAGGIFTGDGQICRNLFTFVMVIFRDTFLTIGAVHGIRRVGPLQDRSGIQVLGIQSGKIDFGCLLTGGSEFFFQVCFLAQKSVPPVL